MTIERAISLKDKTTFRIGGPANYYLEANSIDDVRAAVAYALAKNLEIFVLGAGSNILVSDRGFPGLVIKINLKGIEYEQYPKTVDVKIASGQMWDDVVAEAVEKGYGGIESLSLIPGTVGGAIVQNVGAYGTEIKERVISVDALDMRTGEIKTFRNEHCHFSYRDSFFKSPEGRHFIILSTTLNLRKKASPKLIYKDLIEYFSKREMDNPSLARVRDAVIEIRTLKLPNISLLGTAGSFFKNPVIDRGHFERLQKEYPDMPSFPSVLPGGTEGRKVSLAWIIDKVCALKGYRKGDAGVYEKQALALVNYGSATQADIDALVTRIQKIVFQKTDIQIEREVESV